MRDSPNPRMGFQGEDREKLKTILCWGTWNLNEGPGTRVDDPGELFDTFGPFDAEETRRPRYVAVERLNTTLNDIWDQTPRVPISRSQKDFCRGAWPGGRNSGRGSRGYSSAARGPAPACPAFPPSSPAPRPSGPG